MIEHVMAVWAGKQPPGAPTSNCPTCQAVLEHEFRPGRRRIYCSNSCKQRAYRYRRAHAIRCVATPWLPADRSNSWRTHVQRPAADPVSRIVDGRRRSTTLCGTFGHAVSAGPAVLHTEFVPGAPSACKSCTRLIGADPEWFVHYPVIERGPGPLEVRFRPPEERLAQYQAEHSQGGPVAATGRWAPPARRQRRPGR